MNSQVFRTAAEIGRDVASGLVTATEVLEEHLAHIAVHNPTINAMVTLDAEGAMRRANEIDSQPAGEHPELWGVPVSIKDAFMVRGMRSTGGYPPLSDYVPEYDATVVAHLRSAGAIILGKTNVPVLSTDTQTHNEIFGRTVNPWNVDRTPGGSSGGSAAAVASGMVPLDIGSDVAGSVRIPAHYCGIYSLKPTQYRVSTFGHIPPVPGTPPGINRLSVAGPLARSVDDLELALRWIAGADEHNFDIPPVALEEVLAPPIGDLKIAWTDRLGHVPVTLDTERVLAQAIEALVAAGATATKQVPAGFRFPGLWEIFGTLYWSEVSARLTPEEDEQVAYDVGFTVDSEDAFSRGAGKAVHATMRTYAQAYRERNEHVAALNQLLQAWDVFVCPVAATPAIPHIPHMSKVIVAGQEINYFERGTYYCIPFNLTGHPVVVIPTGYSDDGLPIGIQIVGQRWGEMRLLAIARAMDRIIGAYRRPPGF